MSKTSKRRTPKVLKLSRHRSKTANDDAEVRLNGHALNATDYLSLIVSTVSTPAEIDAALAETVQAVSAWRGHVAAAA